MSRHDDQQPVAAPATRRSWPARLFYDALWILSRTLGVALLGIRYRFAEPLPPQGGLLVISSHQSFLDPLLLGLVCDRRISNLARSSLFRFGPFSAIISALDAVPIDREASSVASMKTVIRKLQGGVALVMFPEGTRTSDGSLGDLKGGFSLIARRAGVPIVPVAIVGAYECWPRSRPFPLPGRIRLEFGRVISAAEVAAMDDKTLVAEVKQRMAALDAEARRVRSAAPRFLSPRRSALSEAPQGPLDPRQGLTPGGGRRQDSRQSDSRQSDSPQSDRSQQPATAERPPSPPV
ncbi:MAG: 1-acyl-sn-glycerol-3-phosphate acyltransferase [Planctomycetota bacterium]|nr:MAG: 1-acyl-sn-glycerol-3-phosphate acyltransferase [Planctomycetota bacterium]